MVKALKNPFQASFGGSLKRTGARSAELLRFHIRQPKVYTAIQLEAGEWHSTEEMTGGSRFLWRRLCCRRQSIRCEYSAVVIR